MWKFYRKKGASIYQYHTHTTTYCRCLYITWFGTISACLRFASFCYHLHKRNEKFKMPIDKSIKPWGENFGFSIFAAVVLPTISTPSIFVWLTHHYTHTYINIYRFYIMVMDGALNWFLLASPQKTSFAPLSMHKLLLNND